MAIIENRGKEVVVLGRGGKKVAFSGKSEADARAVMNKINFLRKQNEKNGGSEHLREAPIEVSSK